MWNQVEDLLDGACDPNMQAGPDVVSRQRAIVEVCRAGGGNPYLMQILYRINQTMVLPTERTARLPLRIHDKDGVKWMASMVGY